jgi:outer membrane protein assembly factor BamE (lipoprotein component of BamABCDE complex)
MKYKIIKNITYLACFFVLSSCVDNITSHGIIIEAEQIKKMRIGKTKLNVVNALLGPASLRAIRENKQILYYINYKFSKKALKKQAIIDFQITELIFSKNYLQAINYFDMQDFNKIDFNLDYTPYNKSKQNIFKELLNNLGRFDDGGDL